MLKTVLARERRVGGEVRFATLHTAVQKSGIVRGGLHYKGDRLNVVVVTCAGSKAVSTALNHPCGQTTAGAAVVSRQAAVEHHHTAIAVLLGTQLGVS